MAHNKVADTAFLVGTVKGESKDLALDSFCVSGLVCHSPPRAPKAAFLLWLGPREAHMSVSGLSTVTLILTAAQEDIS